MFCDTYKLNSSLDTNTTLMPITGDIILRKNAPYIEVINVEALSKGKAKDFSVHRPHISSGYNLRSWNRKREKKIC